MHASAASASVEHEIKHELPATSGCGRVDDMEMEQIDGAMNHEQVCLSYGNEGFWLTFFLGHLTR